MPDRKECPMCGEMMRLKESESAALVPGDPTPIKHVTREWVCPDCDYFEEAEEEPV